MILVGADLATASGLCAGRPDTTPHATAVRGPSCGDDLGIYGYFFWKYFNTYFQALERRLEPGEGIVSLHEAPIMPRPKWDEEKRKLVSMTTIQTTRKLQGLGMIYETVIQYRIEELKSPIQAFEANLITLKNELAGHSKAKKSDMILVARRAGIDVGDDEESGDRADGFAAWLLNVRYQAPRKDRDYWDRRVHSGTAFRG